MQVDSSGNIVCYLLSEEMQQHNRLEKPFKQKIIGKHRHDVRLVGMWFSFSVNCYIGLPVELFSVV